MERCIVVGAGLGSQRPGSGPGPSNDAGRSGAALKNNGLLPLKSSGKTIIVLGPNADTVPHGGGSGRMDPIEDRNITLYAGLSKLGKGYKVELMDWNAPDYDAIRQDIISAKARGIVAVKYN